MSMNLFLGRIYCVPISRSATAPLASSNAPTETSPPNLNFATQYLIQSCALSSDEALEASKRIQQLKSPDKPDAVLRFLREIGVNETDIRSAVSKDARFLCCNVEKKWRPNVGKLQELGFSIQDISGIIAFRPRLFRYNLVPKLDFWVQTLGSTEFLSLALKSGMSLFSSSLEKVLIPNLSFLKDECGFSPLQIVRLIRFRIRSITYRPEVLRRNIERAEQLGVARSSGYFLYALNIVSSLSHNTIESRINNLKSLGLSREEVTTIVSKFPLVLSHTEEKIAHKIEFLINEFSCDNPYLAQNPALLTYSLDKRLIPRNLVHNLLKSKGILVANQPAASFVMPTEKQFLVKFVMPYEHAIPGLQRAYEDACC